MRKEIKMWGNTAIIKLTKDELKVYGWKIGDFVDLEISKQTGEETGEDNGNTTDVKDNN